MASAPAIALRFQRAELEHKADLSAAGMACLLLAAGPRELVTALQASSDPRDAVYALAMMLPHRQAVWWACLGLRLLPDLAARPAELAAVEVAEAWVQSVSQSDAERAGVLADACDLGKAAGWTAMAAYWSGSSLAPRGQQAVPPAPHLPGIAARTALLLLAYEPALAGRVRLADLLAIGVDLMHGDAGRAAQTTVRARLSGGG